MGPRGFWIALEIVLLYLIARPPIGTVSYATIPPAALPSGLPPGARRDYASAAGVHGPARLRFRCGCFPARNRPERAYCASRYALLWGR